jgi:Zn-dependent peptidase ImmA (M78 family)
VTTQVAGYTQLSMANLLERLEEKGLQAKYVRDRALPTWWDADIEDDPTVVAEAAGYIAKRLGLDVTSVFTPDAAIEFKGKTQTKFKKRKNTDEQSLEVTQGLALRVAEIVQYATPLTYELSRLSAAEIRQRLLVDAPAVCLSNLVSFCGSIGIPVVHYADLPQGVKKVDGLVACFNGQPVIVICCAKQSYAWLAFILAHELGHILCGHVTGSVFIDEDIAKEEQDIEEIEANEFAATLLLGNFKNHIWQQVRYPSVLVNQAKELAILYQLDPATICLNYAWQTKDWSSGMAAVNQLEKKANAPALINRYLAHHLDWERLDRDTQDYLRLVLGA